jgi:hypothetical protein
MFKKKQANGLLFWFFLKFWALFYYSTNQFWLVLYFIIIYNA